MESTNDADSSLEYLKVKTSVKLWEKDFVLKNGRKPNKVSFNNKSKKFYF